VKQHPRFPTTPIAAARFARPHALLLLLLTAAGTGVSGCGSLKQKNAAPTVATPQPIPANNFALGWTTDLKTKGDNLDELHLLGDTLFIYTKKDEVWAVDRAGGEIRYVAQPDVSGGTLRPPVQMGQYVVYPCGSTIEVFNNRGRALRTLELDKPTRSGAVASGNNLYIGLDHTGGTGVMASLNITRPYRFINWELMTFGAVSPTPAIYDKIIFCGSEDGRIYAVTEDRGGIWALENHANWFQTQGRFVSDIKADDFGVYASNTDSKLYCLERQTGHIKWQYFAAAPLKTAPVVSKDSVYQYVPGTGVVALDKLQGAFNRAPRWIAGNAIGYLAEDAQNVYLRRRDNVIIAVDKMSGNTLFTSKSHAYDLFVENQADSTIYAATRSGRVAAIRPILREGEVGTIVMGFSEEPLAAATPGR